MGIHGRYSQKSRDSCLRKNDVPGAGKASQNFQQAGWPDAGDWIGFANRKRCTWGVQGTDSRGPVSGILCDSVNAVYAAAGQYGPWTEKGLGEGAMVLMHRDQ